MEAGGRDGRLHRWSRPRAGHALVRPGHQAKSRRGAKRMADEEPPFFFITDEKELTFFFEQM
jgi:hypothetical protein